MSEARTVMRPPLERLVFFSDAAVAIAITLLVLPLMDGVREAADAGLNAFDYLGANASSVTSFVLSFAIIALFWRAHHRLFAHLAAEPPGIFWLNMSWLLAIVFLPVATAIIGAMPSGPAQLAVYIGTMLVISAALAAIAEVARHHPECWEDGTDLTRREVDFTWATVALMAAALVIAVLWPQIGYWSLLLLAIRTPARRLSDRIAGRRANHRAAR